MGVYCISLFSKINRYFIFIGFMCPTIFNSRPRVTFVIGVRTDSESVFSYRIMNGIGVPYLLIRCVCLILFASGGAFIGVSAYSFSLRWNNGLLHHGIRFNCAFHA